MVEVESGRAGHVYGIKCVFERTHVYGYKFLLSIYDNYGLLRDTHCIRQVGIGALTSIATP